MKLLLLLLPGLAVLSTGPRVAQAMPRFSNVFQSGMVLQRDVPLKLWGFGAGVNPCIDPTDIIVDIDLGPIKAATVAADGDTWSVTFPPQKVPAGVGYTGINLKCGGNVVQQLEDVAFGDVFLFSGQSNIDISASYAHQFNASAEAEEEAFADAMGQTGFGIRYMTVPNQVNGLDYNSTSVARELASVPDCKPCPASFDASHNFNNCQCNAMRWRLASGTSVRGFSATAWYTGKALKQSLLANVPIGLVRSSWGGTTIQSWSSPDAIGQCPGVTKTGSKLFNGMIAPFAGLRFKAVVWYQGESNTGPDAAFAGPQYYGCALPALIKDWRTKLGDASLPFFVVELSAYCNENNERTYKTWCDQQTTKLTAADPWLPAMRLAQAAGVAKMKVVNATTAPVVMVTAMDLGSLHPLAGSIHSDKKVELGRRIGLALSATVYGKTATVYAGPTATSAVATEAGGVLVKFGLQVGVSAIAFNSTARCPAPTLKVFCTGAGFEVRVDGVWAPAAASLVGSSSVLVTARSDAAAVPDRVRYAHADWPVVSLRNAADAGESGLPARLFDLAVTTE